MRRRWLVRRWATRVTLLLATDAVLLAGLRWADYHVDLLRFTLLVTACIAAAWLVTDTVTESGPPWSVESRSVVRPPGADVRLGTYVRILEDHAAAREPNGSLRDRLAGLAGERLRIHHGLRLGDPAADDLLGPALVAVLTGPPRRLQPSELDALMTRIEEL
ncbi:MAG: hypothetical protein U0R80_05085 [Nocardioidaceae bacterium]